MKKMAQNGGSITEAYGYEPYESHCLTTMTNPKLLECAVPSYGAVMQAVQRLEPGLLGHCYILPYKREATFIIGYKG